MLFLVDDRSLVVTMQAKTLFDAEDGVLQNDRQTQANDTSCEERRPDLEGFTYSTTTCVECSCCFGVGLMDEEGGCSGG
jgi:hypothetical protein